MTKNLHGRVVRHAVLAILVFAVAITAGMTASPSSAMGQCTFPSLSSPFASFGDQNPYSLAPGGNFEADQSGWTMSNGAGVVDGNETSYVGSSADNRSLALPTKDAAATTPTFCVTTDAPAFRMFIKNNGANGHMDGQLAVYLNFTGADGRQQQVKIAALTSNQPGWSLTPKISFIQYISTPLKSGVANISFTIKPNDNHGNWQLDDLYVDPYCSR
jgi:hypothetical protein